MKNNLIYYLLVIGVLLAAKYGHRYLDLNDLWLLLYPTSELVSYLSGYLSNFISGQGFLFESAKIIIDRSCSGYNFFLLCWSLLSVSMIGAKSSTSSKLLSPFMILPIAYIMTLFANVSRIMTSILLDTSLGLSAPWSHEFQGSFIYLTILASSYFVFDYFIYKHKNLHADLS